MLDLYLWSLSFTKCKPPWTHIHFGGWNYSTKSLTQCWCLWRGQGRDGAFFQVQPFIFQVHLLPHNCFPIVAVAGEMQAAKFGRGGRPCPICAMYAYRFRPFAGKWRVCGELVLWYSIVQSTWASSSYTTIGHASSWSIWLLCTSTRVAPLMRTVAVSCSTCTRDYCDVTAQKGEFQRQNYRKRFSAQQMRADNFQRDFV